MARPTTKKDLIEASNSGYESLMASIDSMTEQELETSFDFRGTKRKRRRTGSATRICGMCWYICMSGIT